MRGRFSTTLLVALGVTGVLSSAGSSAPTTFPGTNGKIALSHGLRADRPGIDLVNPDGSGRTTLPTPGGYSPVWSADGKWLAYSTFPEPWVVRIVRAARTGDREVLPASAGSPATWPTQYAWSPTGSEIAYKCPTGLCAVHVPDGRTRHILEYQSSGGAGPSWSPDGSKIAFGCPGAVLCLVSPDGTGLEGFFGQTGLGIARCCDWSPDGTRVLLTGRTQGMRSTSTTESCGSWWTWVAIPSFRRAGRRTGRAVVVRRFPSVYVIRLDGTPPTKIADGDIGDWGTSPAVTVSTSSLEPRWVLSRQTGRVQLRGTASHASTLSVAVRAAGRTYPPASVPVPAGDYAVSAALPSDLLPVPSRSSSGGRAGASRS